MNDPLKPADVSVILAKLFGKVRSIEDRVLVLEERTINHDLRLEDLEKDEDD